MSMKPHAVPLIDPAEIKVESWPKTEPGGQHVGSGPRGIRITHVSGLVAISVSCRSQHKNRSVAMAMIECGLTDPASDRD